jgi:hypothetical protein
MCMFIPLQRTDIVASFYKKKKSKLYFGDRVAVLNDFIYQTGGSMFLVYLL